MNVGRIVIAGNVKNSTIITGNTKPKLQWIYSLLTESWISTINEVHCEIKFNEEALMYNFAITERDKVIASGSCNSFERTKNMIEGYFHGMV